MFYIYIIPCYIITKNIIYLTFICGSRIFRTSNWTLDGNYFYNTVTNYLIHITKSWNWIQMIFNQL